MDDDLIAFVTARLDEDEAVARRNIGAEPGTQAGLGDTEGGSPSWPDYQTYGGEGTDAAGDYIECFRPLRALREVAAKRAIVDAYARVAYMDIADPEPEYAYGRAVGLGEAVRAIAAVYADHPDYRSEWAP